MKLENREQAKAFLMFLAMERERHLDDIDAIDKSWKSVATTWKISKEEQFGAIAKILTQTTKWIEVD